MTHPKVPARVIAFEGVDGAGKSTVIELVAAHLRGRGVTVNMPRVGKEHRSKPTRMIRRLTRNRANLDLSGRAEMLLYASREAQVLDEHVRPAIARGETVLLDRSMLTSVVLGAYGRGLDLASCEAIAAAASGGLQPDVTLIFDVDPRTSQIRKHLDRVRARRVRHGGRKHQLGTGLEARVRDGYRALAGRDGLPIFHSERSGPADVAARVISQLESGSFSEARVDATPWWLVDPALSFEEAVQSLPPLLQLYFSRRLEVGRSLRAELLEHEPELVIWAVDRDDPSRDRAASLAPALLLSRSRMTPSAALLRESLSESHPVDVARSLKHIVGADADRMREALAEHAPGAVVESLCARSDAFAVALRNQWWKKANTHERAISLQLLDDAVSRRRRTKLLKRDPAVVIPSMCGLATEHVDAALIRYAHGAPKAVLRALHGRNDPRAHALRHELIETGHEVIDSIRGLDDPTSWTLRERCVDRWPAAVAASTAGLAMDPRTPPLLRRCRDRAPGDLFLKRQLHVLDHLRALSGPEARREAFELDI